MVTEYVEKILDGVDAADPGRLFRKIEALAMLGKRDAATKIFAELERNQQTFRGKTGVISPADLGMSYAEIGEKERAFYWLKAYEQHDPALAQLKIDPDADNLRNDPRYQGLLRKLGLSSE